MIRYDKDMAQLEYINQRMYDSTKQHRRDPATWGVSKTVPNLAMPLKELAERIRDGRPVPNIQFPAQPPPLGGEPQFSDADFQEGMRTDPLTTTDKMLTEHKKLSNKLAADKKKAADAQAATQKTKETKSPDKAEAAGKSDGKEGPAKKLADEQ